MAEGLQLVLCSPLCFLVKIIVRRKLRCLKVHCWISTTASRLLFEPGPFCVWVQHANHSATEPPFSLLQDVIFHRQHISEKSPTDHRVVHTSRSMYGVRRKIDATHRILSQVGTWPSCLVFIASKLIFHRQRTSEKSPYKPYQLSIPHSYATNCKYRLYRHKLLHRVTSYIILTMCRCPRQRPRRSEPRLRQQRRTE